MHKYLLTTAILSMALACAYPVAPASAAVVASGGHTCTLPNSKYIEGVGCVYVISDPATVAQQIDPKTGKPIKMHIDYAKECDGKPSGYEFQIPTIDPVTHLNGQTTFRCD